MFFANHLCGSIWRISPCVRLNRETRNEKGTFLDLIILFIIVLGLCKAGVDRYKHFQKGRRSRSDGRSGSGGTEISETESDEVVRTDCAYVERPILTRLRAHLGDVQAQEALGLLYMQKRSDRGRRMPQNDVLAAQWFQKAAYQGSAPAQVNIGVLTQHGRGVPQDRYGAEVWFMVAAQQGFPIALYNLGVQYEKSKYYERARRHYQLAADLGYAPAQIQIGLIYWNNWLPGIAPIDLVPEDLVKAYMWMTLAWENAYESSIKVPEEDVAYQRTHDRAEQAMGELIKSLSTDQQCQAVNLIDEWRKRPRGDFFSKDSGCIKCFKGLHRPGNFCLECGKEILKDLNDTPSLTWRLLKRFEKGDAAAQFDLGVMYEDGQGVEEDLVEAVRWYRLAADQGHASAKNWIEKTDRT